MQTLPLLEQVPHEKLRAWRFLRDPGSYLVGNAKAGWLLVEHPAPSIMYRDGREEPWSVWTPDASRYKGIPARWAHDFLRIDRHGREPACVEAWDAVDSVGIAILRADAPRAGLRTGDVVVLRRDAPPSADAEGFRLFTRDGYEALRADLENAPDLLEDIQPGHWADYLCVPLFLSDRRGWGGKLRDWYSRLGAFRPEVGPTPRTQGEVAHD